jgi:hypothetical protein
VIFASDRELSFALRGDLVVVHEQFSRRPATDLTTSAWLGRFPVAEDSSNYERAALRSEWPRTNYDLLPKPAHLCDGICKSDHMSYPSGAEWHSWIPSEPKELAQPYSLDDGICKNDPSTNLSGDVGGLLTLAAEQKLARPCSLGGGICKNDPEAYLSDDVCGFLVLLAEERRLVRLRSLKGDGI